MIPIRIGMTPQFGMPSLIECPDPQSCFALAQRLGLQFIELNMNLPEYQLDAIDEDLAESLMRETGIFLTLHLDENLNPCDFNPAVADAYTHTALGAVALAKRLHSPVVNMHLSDGVYFTLPDRKVYLFEQYKARYLSELRRFRDRCIDASGDDGPLICIENCGGFKPFQLQGLEMLLESPRFALTFDIGHDRVAHNDEPYIMSHIDRLRHMHLHDATARQSHLTLGDGELDIRRMLQIAQDARCRCVVETKSVESLTRSVGFIRSIELR